MEQISRRNFLLGEVNKAKESAKSNQIIGKGVCEHRQ
jgi:hypothetical protein